MGRNTYWDSKKTKKLRKLSQTMKASEIAREFGTTISAVRTQMSPNGIKVPKELHGYQTRRLDVKSVKAIKRLLVKGTTNKVISNKYGVTPGTVSAIKYEKTHKEVTI